MMSWFSGIIKKNRSNFIKDFNPSNRWIHYSNGAIVDKENKSQTVWITDSDWFEKWFFGMEERLGVILGKMLIQASSESTEYSLINNQISTPKNKNIENWEKLLEDWMYKNFGSFSSYSQDYNQINLIINNYANLYISVGSLSSALEYLNNTRYKFHWKDSETRIILSLEPSSDMFPSPNSQNILNYDFSQVKKISNSDLWEMLSVNEEGTWFIQHSRPLVISNDLFYRFEEKSIPFLSNISFERSIDYDWGELDTHRSNWWTASADSARQQFIESSHHIMIREDNDWKKVGKKHLNRYGLGGIIDVESLDNFGEIIFEIESFFHPSIICGILLACWERAYGKKGKLSLTSKEEVFFVKISSSHVTQPLNINRVS
ncbi:MAG: hypothetical protein ACJZ4Z_06465 [Candidatus Thalassarchaeaceae archaeon]